MQTDRTADSVASRVAANIKDLRAQRVLTVRTLAQRLKEIGYPTLTSTVSKIELGQQKIGVNDLVSYAVALGVTPNRLLLTRDVDDGAVALTPGVQASQVAAWWWATGEQRLPGPYSPPEQQFVAENRPHDPPDNVTLEQLLELEANGVLDAVLHAYAAARSAGLSAKTITNYLALQERRGARRELEDIDRAVFGRDVRVEHCATGS